MNDEIDFEFNDLLSKHAIDLSTVLLMRHRPTEPELRNVLPWLANERPKVFCAYQALQSPRVDKQLQKAQYLASFIGHEAGKCIFIGLYEVVGWKRRRKEQVMKIPEQMELAKLGMQLTESEYNLFEFKPIEVFERWKGKMIVHWPSPEIVWSRWAKGNRLPISELLDESMLVGAITNWRNLSFSWEELSLIPQRWKDTLSRWRGVYYISDKRDGKGYVGSAYGEEGLFGRWMNYAKTGHGDNKLLKVRTPESFQFSILEWASPDMEDREIIEREGSWKIRLNTRYPFGLNEN